MNKKGHCNALELLKAAGLSRTAQRERILETLLHSDRPVSAKDVLEGCRDSRINRVTVYRILESFRRQGIVRELPTESGVKYFEIACRHNPLHPHFFCRQCGEMACLGPLTVADTWEWFARPHAFRIDEIVVSICGLCQECGKKINAK